MTDRWYAGIGSRETPIEIWNTMYQIGRYMPFLGWGLSSGGAVKQPDSGPEVGSADDAFYQGALSSPALNPASMLRIYLINAHWEHYKPNPRIGLLNALDYPDTWDEAMRRMEEARGTLAGLRDAGLKMHTRNVYQVFGHTLRDPIKSMICYAKPIGTRGQYKGGTNTAIQLAKRAEIPIMNLYEDDAMRRAQEFVTMAQQRFANQILVA
jgi:hypothetical protein